jgi:hypothetical protein
MLSFYMPRLPERISELGVSIEAKKTTIAKRRDGDKD